MKLQKSSIEIIKMRSSCRTFDSCDIEDEKLQKLKDYIEEINTETKIRARFLFIKQQKNSSGSSEKIGTYGVISGANSFVVGIIHKDERDAVEFGYLFEKIILFATDLGLQTCWLGGTFKKSDFEQYLSMNENEFIPIVSPVGIKKEKPRLLETAMRAVIGANNKKPWNELFFDGNVSTPLNKNIAGAYDVPIEMVRLGPSASNKQPWRIIKDKNLFHFYLCRNKGYKVGNYDMQKNDLGIATCHFELAAKELGLNGKWEELANINSPKEWEYIITWIEED